MNTQYCTFVHFLIWMLLMCQIAGVMCGGRNPQAEAIQQSSQASSTNQNEVKPIMMSIHERPLMQSMIEQHHPALAAHRALSRVELCGSVVDRFQ